MSILEDRDVLSDLINQLPHFIFWKDTDLVFQGCNKKFAEQFGFKDVVDVIGKTDQDFPWSSSLRNKYVSDDVEIISHGLTKLNFEEEQKQKDGSVKTVLVSKVPLYDSNSNITGVLGIYTDISERKKMELDLKEAKQKAEESSELKSQFMLNMQHDLRTPASGMAGMLEILATQELDPDKKRVLKQLSGSSRKLLNILNAILEFDSFENGTFPVLSEKFNLKEMIEDVKALQFPAAKLKQLKTNISIDDRIPQAIIGDPFRLQRILINLLSNAIKFTVEGYIAIEAVFLKKFDNENILIQISVKDTGVGIPADKENIIFEKFARLDPSNKGLYSGLGLGLSVVKQFVQEMGGSLEFNSQLDKGSTFICTLPFKLPTIAVDEKKGEDNLSMAVTQADELQYSASKILLVEDNAIARLVANSLLSDNFKVSLDVVSTGQEAFDLIRQSTCLYDLIFMDIGLPDGSGCNFAKKIHAISPNPAKIPIVALTAHNGDQAKKICDAAGMQDFLAKPLDKAKILKIFKKWLHPSLEI